MSLAPARPNHRLRPSTRRLRTRHMGRSDPTGQVSASTLSRPNPVVACLVMTAQGRRRLGALAVWLFAITATVGTTARAADSVEAEALIREGIALRRSGNDARALPLFQKA